MADHRDAFDIEAGFYPEDDTQQRANEVWQDAFDAIAKARGGA